MTKIIVLTSRENFVWHSMQEIIPYIESTWQNMTSSEFKVEVLNIDVLSLSELTPRLISADKLVITCFNYRMCKVMQYIREILRLNLGFVIHVHNLATIAFWPYRYFASSEMFTKSDVFITSSNNDKKTLEKIFVRPLVHVIPFFVQQPLAVLSKTTLNQPQNIVYIGRISPQKNLHNLILAYSLLKKNYSAEIPPLVLFGKEDHLGCPNMNFRNDNYLYFLQQLTSELGLSGDIFFKGHVDRELIDSFLKEKSNLIVSVSLHSDENFGMAVLQGLISGNKAVLSDWGGHSDFKNYFDNLVELMPITLSEYGPALSAEVIAQALFEAVSKDSTNLNLKIDSYYQKAYYLNEQKNAVAHNFLPIPLRYSELADHIYEAKLDFTTSSTQIFSAFNDRLFLEISKYYVGEKIAVSFSPMTNEYFSVPWMKFHENNFIISDPHKGQIVIPNDSGIVKKFICNFRDKTSLAISKETCERLFKNGFINRLN